MPRWLPSVGLHAMLSLAAFCTVGEWFSVYADDLPGRIFWAIEIILSLFLAYRFCSMRDDLKGVEHAAWNTMDGKR